MHIEFPLPVSSAIADFVEGQLSPHFPAVCEWSKVLGAAFEGQSFSDIHRDLSVARRNAALGGLPLEEQLAALVCNDKLPKARRIGLATNLVKSGLLSQRKVHDITGVARDTIRTHTAREKRKKSKPANGAT
jgi:hypothetical protein